MLKTARPWQAALMLLVCLFVAACKSKVTAENYAKIKTGMTQAEVEAILGEGTVESGDGTAVANQFGVDLPGAGKVPEFHVWRGGDKTIRVQYHNGRVKYSDMR
jgi:hypothetical protein